MPPWAYSASYYEVNDPDIYYKNKIARLEEFASLAASEQVPVPATVLKCVYINSVVYFMDTKSCKFHYKFLTSQKIETRSLSQFNFEVYSGQKRDVICASIVRYRSGDSFVYAFEMPPTDPLKVDSSAPVRSAFDAFQKAIGTVFTMSVRPTSFEQKENIMREDHPLHGIPQVDISNIWASIDYTPIVQARTYGTVRVLESATSEEVNNLTMTDIVVFQSGIPNEIPPVAGVILREPMPPLCHVALLCRNRRTPCAYVSKSYLIDFHAFSNNWMLFQVGPSRFEFSKADPSKQNGKNLAQYLKQPIALPIGDLKLPVPLWTLPPSCNASSIGAKAFQLWRLNKVVRQEDFQEKSFAIPFGAYMEHIKSPTIAAAIQAIPDFRSDSPPSPSEVMGPLARVQQAIVDAEIDYRVLQEAMQLIRRIRASRYIFRSSTNAEDVEGFNAAGLYDSVVLGEGELTEDKVANAIKAVWSSTWNIRAFLERVVFGIPSTNVAMCVLVQPHFSDGSLSANGVATTANPFDKEKHGVYITSFPGGSHRATDSSALLVRPRNDYNPIYPSKPFSIPVSSTAVTPEQIIVHMSRVAGLFEPEFLVPSSGAGVDGPVLTSDQASELAQLCASLHAAFLKEKIEDAPSRAKERWSTCLDIEWLLVRQPGREPKIVIIQARPCPVQWPN